MTQQNRNTEIEKIYLPRGGVVMIEYDKKSAKPLIRAYIGM